MRIFTPANNQELSQIENQVQSALASTLDINLKRPEKLRELTCRILGYENGFQQLKTHMGHSVSEHSSVKESVNHKDFLEWLSVAVVPILALRERVGFPEEALNILSEVMDQAVYDWCGTGKHVSDGINNQGLEAQIKAIYEASGTYKAIIDALKEELPELEHDCWSHWKADTARIPMGVVVSLIKAERWGWENRVTSASQGPFSSRAEAIDSAIEYSATQESTLEDKAPFTPR